MIRYEPSDRLLSCQLWPGSIISLLHKHKALKLEDVEKTAKALNRLPHDDLLPGEAEFRDAINADLAAIEKRWEFN